MQGYYNAGRIFFSRRNFSSDFAVKKFYPRNSIEQRGFFLFKFIQQNLTAAKNFGVSFGMFALETGIFHA